MLISAKGSCYVLDIEENIPSKNRGWGEGIKELKARKNYFYFHTISKKVSRRIDEASFQCSCLSREERVE